MKDNNPDLLQEEEEQEAEEANDDPAINAEENKIDESKNDVVVSI